MMMGVIVKISKNSSRDDTRLALQRLLKKSANRKKKSLKDFFGKLPNAFGDGLEYQKKVRNEW
jgi:hypothetical protein